MASAKLLEYFLDYYKKFPHDYPSLNLQNACPVIIEFCDASAHSRYFSEAVVDFRLSSGLPLSFFFHQGHEELMQYILGITKQPNQAIVRLENFIADIEKHTNCLKCLFDKKDREQKGITSECHIQVIIAAHLFGPLAGDNSFTIGNKGFSKDVRECPVCKLDITATLGNTSFGNGSVWHGFADVFVKRSVVKVAEKTEVSSSYEVEHKERTGGSDEPFTKKRKYEECGDGFDSNSSFESDSVVEVKKDCIDANAISQGLAQTIVNAYCETKMHQPLRKSFIPSFIATCQHVKIAMYNCDLDRLIMTPDLRLLVKLDVDQDAFLDFSTVLSVWFALNFEIYVEKLELFEAMVPVCNFQKMAGSKLPLYKNHCLKPMEVKADVSPSEYNLNPESRQIVANALDRQVKHCRQLKEMLNKMA